MVSRTCVCSCDRLCGTLTYDCDVCVRVSACARTYVLMCIYMSVRVYLRVSILRECLARVYVCVCARAYVSYDNAGQSNMTNLFPDVIAHTFYVYTYERLSSLEETSSRLSFALSVWSMQYMKQVAYKKQVP